MFTFTVRRSAGAGVVTLPFRNTDTTVVRARRWSEPGSRVTIVTGSRRRLTFGGSNFVIEGVYHAEREERAINPQ